MDLTRPIAEFVTQTRLDDIDALAAHHARWLLIDAVGCALAGHGSREFASMRGALTNIGTQGDATVIGEDRHPLLNAVFLNAYLITALTACDFHVPTRCHVTPEVVPAALAVGERFDRGGEELLTSVALAAEVTVRVGVAFDFSAKHARGWHAPGLSGVIGAAAAAGRMLGLDAPRMVNALALAAAQAAGTFVGHGTPQLKFNQARAALSGVLAAFIGAEAFPTTLEPFLGVNGGLLTPTYTDHAHPELLVDQLGEVWELLEISVRRWPAGTSIQSVIDCLLEITTAHAVGLDDVKRLEVTLAPASAQLHGHQPHPQTPFLALLSTHYVAAALLEDGHFWLPSVAPSRLADPRLQAFADRVVVSADDSVPDAGAVTSLLTHDGRTLVARRDFPRGHPSDPLSDDEMRAKFLRCAQERLDTARARRLLAMLERLEHVSVREILSAATPGAA